MQALTRMTRRFTRANTRSAMLLSTLAATSSVLALVIWIKLRVVTHIPRSAYAEPNDEAPREASGPYRAGGEAEGTHDGTSPSDTASAGDEPDPTTR